MSVTHAQSVPNPIASVRHILGATASHDDVAVLTLDERGTICDCNHAGEALFKYRRSELAWQRVSMLIPRLANMELMQNGRPHPHLHFLSRIGHRFEVVTQDGERFPSQLFFNVIDGKGHPRLSIIIRREGQQDDESKCSTDNTGNVAGKYAAPA